MSAFLIAYAIVGLITWAGIVLQIHFEGYQWGMRDIYHVPYTMLALILLWPIGIAHWQSVEWKKVRRHG